MYKSKLIGLVLVIAMLAGCSTKESVSQPAQTEPPIDLPYEIIRDDDGYYLVLDDSSATDDEVEGSLQVLAPRIEFGSMDEMVRDIKTGNFTEKELQNLSDFARMKMGVPFCAICLSYTMCIHQKNLTRKKFCGVELVIILCSLALEVTFKSICTVFLIHQKKKILKILYPVTAW